ncbi:hypothetical protein Tco_1050118 [Tanacetum coccineum]
MDQQQIIRIMNEQGTGNLELTAARTRSQIEYERMEQSRQEFKKLIKNQELHDADRTESRAKQDALNLQHELGVQQKKKDVMEARVAITKEARAKEERAKDAAMGSQWEKLPKVVKDISKKAAELGLEKILEKILLLVTKDIIRPVGLLLFTKDRISWYFLEKAACCRHRYRWFLSFLETNVCVGVAGLRLGGGNAIGFGSSTASKMKSGLLLVLPVSKWTFAVFCLLVFLENLEVDKCLCFQL